MCNSFARIGEGLRLMLASLVALALLLIVVLVFYQVITRYFTGSATADLAEIARFLFIWLVFLGSAWLVSRNELIAIDFFSAKMSVSKQRVLRGFIDLCIAFMLVCLLVYTDKLLDVVSIKRAPATGLPYGLVYLALPTFCILGLYFIFERAVLTRGYSIAPQPTTVEA